MGIGYLFVREALVGCETWS